jgi:NRAMP (natural resistance-associated macrophage protein)-like metal ion transporter
MTTPLKPQGLEPQQDLDFSGLAERPAAIRRGQRLTIRGRSVRLRGLRQPRTGPLRWLYILGPGLIAASAGNDAGGIAAYSSAGAQFGYSLIWVMVVLTLALGVIQETAARIGAATGRGLLDLVRERFGLRWSLLLVGIILVANGGLIISEFVGIVAAAHLLGISPYIAVPVGAVLLWYLVLFGSYPAVEKIFLAMTLVFFAYPVAAVLAHPNWAELARGALIPTIIPSRDYMLVLVGLLGTTVTPYMQIFEQSSVVERGVPRRQYGPERVDAYVGAIFSDVMSIAMIVATAATLHVHGPTILRSAEDAARALEPVAGASASVLFAVGLLGASLLAGSVLPLATAYAVSETFGLAKGINLDFRRAPQFYGLFTAMLLIGAALALIPNLPVIQWLIVVQVFNGLMLPIVLFFLLRLANDQRLMGGLKNSRLINLLSWGAYALITTAVLALFAMEALGALGIPLFGG